MATFNSSEPDSAVQISSNGAEQLHDYQGDANTLSPMETNHHVIKNNDNNTKADLMTMSTPPHLLSSALETSEDGQPLPPKRYYNHRNSTALQKEREERVRKIREQQEEERKKKVEELKSHAAQQQKFREIQEVERRKRMEEQRARDHDKYQQVEERRRAIEYAERERRSALLKKNQEREGKIFAKKKAQNSQTYFAFGSCTPRMGYSMSGGGRSDSGSDVLRSTSSSNMANMTQSMYSTSSSSRHQGGGEHQVNHQRRSSEREMNGSNGAKRATSVHALDQSAEIDAEGDNSFNMANSNSSSASAHRRRTDLMPTITFSSASPAGSAGMGTGNGYSRSSTPGNRMLRSPGRSPSAMSSGGTDTPAGTGVPVKLRPGTASNRRPRPISIATTGVMSTSMYEKRSTLSNANTPTRFHHISAGFDKSSKNSDMKSKRPVTKSASADHKDEDRSTKPPSRKTPAQVKAESAARKAKALTKSPTPPLKKQYSRDSMEKQRENSTSSSKESSVEKQEVEAYSKTAVAPETELEDETLVDQTGNEAEQTGSTEVPTSPVREATPDIIRKSPVKEVVSSANIVDTNATTVENQNQINQNTAIPDQTPKKIINSEEEAKARLAEKRREMKEKMEREAELERQRQAELERLEAERKAKEEEEERLAMVEAERLAVEARKAEEERLQKAIEEAQKREEEEKRKKEEEEQKRKEAERKAKEEAERKQAELDEKLKKDEEERLARKKRLDEIMARTRGAKSTNSTPKKEATPATPETSIEPEESVVNKEVVTVSDAETRNNNGDHSSLEDPTGDPTKPDLLGDISDVSECKTTTNGLVATQEPVIVQADQNEASEDKQALNDDGLEKGIVDMNISEQAKEEEQIMNAKNEEASLLDLDSGSSVNLLKQAPPLLETAQDAQQPEFDQIIDLTNNSNEDSNVGGDNLLAPPLMATPLIAFEDSINTSPKQEVPTADLLS